MSLTLPGTPLTPNTPNTPLLNGDLAQIDDTTGKAPEGIVLPPRDIRAIVEKTAGYVARNGQVFEQRIREKEKHNAKFAFLNTVDPYYAFYSWRLDEIRAGRGTDVAAGRAGSGTPAVAEPEKPKGPAPPPEFRFSARMPNISTQDLDIVRLTALFTAKHGRSFLTPLSQREGRNYQFDFLRPNHSLYQFFTRLVDQYTELLNPNGGPGMEELERNVREKFHILDKARGRAEWTKHQEKERSKKEEEEDAERMAYAQIDWHDFVIVETVLFTDADELTDLPPPTSLNELQSASLEQKAMMSLHPTTLRIEEAMPTSDPVLLPPAQYQPYYPPPVSASAPLPAAGPAPSTDYTMLDARSAPPLSSATDDSARRAAAAASSKPGAMKIRNDYAPRALQKRAAAQEATGICPNCNQAIPLNEMEAHMRIELLDPRWKEQRARAEAKFATTNLNTNDTVLNLKRLASQREDLFDSSTGETISMEEAERRKKQATGGSWDGAADSRDAMWNRTFDVSEQIQAIHRKAGQVANPGVGPRREG